MAPQQQQHQGGELQPLLLPAGGEGDSSRSKDDDDNATKKQEGSSSLVVVLIVGLLVLLPIVVALSKNIQYDRNENKFNIAHDHLAHGIHVDKIDWDLYDVAYVNLIRHGEKGFEEPDDNHLSQIGYDRAEYYAQCIMSNATTTYAPTLAFPKPLGSLMAQRNATVYPPYKGNVGLSQRSYETLQPLSKVTGKPIDMSCKMTDYDCFQNTILFNLIQPNRTVLVSWEHKMFPKLLRLLLTKTPYDDYDDYDEENTHAPKSILSTPEGQQLLSSHYKKWPELCDAQSWKDPLEIKKEKLVKGKLAFAYHNACFDRVWQIRYVRLKTEQHNNNDVSSAHHNPNHWTPINVRSVNNGYGGSKTSPCEEGLRPLSDKQYCHYFNC